MLAAFQASCSVQLHSSVRHLGCVPGWLEGCRAGNGAWCVDVQREKPQSWGFLEALHLLRLDFRAWIALGESWLIQEGETHLALEEKGIHKRQLTNSLWLLWLWTNSNAHTAAATTAAGAFFSPELISSCQEGHLLGCTQYICTE